MSEMSPQEYAAMMDSSVAHVAAAHAAGGDMRDAIRAWQKTHGPLSKGEIRIVLTRVVPRVIRRRRAA